MERGEDVESNQMGKAERPQEGGRSTVAQFSSPGWGDESPPLMARGPRVPSLPHSQPVSPVTHSSGIANPGELRSPRQLKSRGGISHGQPTMPPAPGDLGRPCPQPLHSLSLLVPEEGPEGSCGRLSSGCSQQEVSEHHLGSGTRLCFTACSDRLAPLGAKRGRGWVRTLRRRGLATGLRRWEQAHGHRGPHSCAQGLVWACSVPPAGPQACFQTQEGEGAPRVNSQA